MRTIPRQPRPCKTCGTLVVGESYCNGCMPAAQRERNRRKAVKGQPYRTTAWEKARTAAILRDHRMCVVCSTTRQLTVHHIDHDKTNNRQTNLATLCQRCHGHVEGEAQGGHLDGSFHRELAAYVEIRDRPR